MFFVPGLIFRFYRAARKISGSLNHKKPLICGVFPLAEGGEMSG
jgi:hypothetical protein